MVKPYVIGITGGSGSGKTSILHRISEGFEPNELSILLMDNYYKDRDQQEYDENGVQNFDLFSSIDTEAYLSDILEVISGKTLVRKEYGFNNFNYAGKELTITPAPILIVEGIFLFHIEKLMPHLDLKIFVDAKDAIKIIRRIKRDRLERNYPLDDVLYRYESHVLPAYEQFIEPYKNMADMIINNNGDPAAIIYILRTFIRSRIDFAMAKPTFQS